MTKILNGLELVGYIKERQAKQVRNLRQSHGVFPKLVIISTSDNPVIDTYVRLKKSYGEDILIETQTIDTTMSEIRQVIDDCNKDDSVHGIIVQLPLANIDETDEIISLILPQKDVDGLGKNAEFDAATPMAINWLLAGYNIDLSDKNVVLIGRGRLVGAPLERLLQNSGVSVKTIAEPSDDLGRELQDANVIVSATGVPGLVTSEMVPSDVVVVDAGTASENGEIVGDVASDVRQREDVAITPLKGGVGPLTVAALFDNVITAARNTLAK